LDADVDGNLLDGNQDGSILDLDADVDGDTYDNHTETNHHLLDHVDDLVH
jgi:hypothetical protein